MERSFAMIVVVDIRDRQSNLSFFGKMEETAFFPAAYLRPRSYIRAMSDMLEDLGIVCAPGTRIQRNAAVKGTLAISFPAEAPVENHVFGVVVPLSSWMIPAITVAATRSATGVL